MKFTHTIKTYLAIVLAVGALLLFVQSTSRYIHEIVTNKRVQIAAVGSIASCSNWSNLSPTTGLYFANRGAFYLLDSDGSGYTQEILFGPKKDTLMSVAGDWTNRGFSSIGYYDPDTGTFYLKYETTPGPADISFAFGRVDPGSIVALAGDWNDDGRFTVGVYDKKEGKFYLKNTNTSQEDATILSIPGVPAGATPLAGDWMGDGTTRVGLFDPNTSTFYLRNTNDPSNTNVTSFVFRGPSNSWTPAVGRWTTASKADGVGLQNGTTVIPRGAEPLYITPQGFAGKSPDLLSGVWKPSRCLQTGENTAPKSPDWAKDMIFYHVRIETFTPERTLRAAMGRLAYLHDLGVTGIVLTSITTLDSTHWDTRQQVFYGPSRPNLIDPRIGTDEDMRAFVAEAHRLGMRVIADNVMHGIKPESPYIPSPVEGVTYNPQFIKNAAALPEDFFNHTPAGSIRKTSWGTAQWDWTSLGLRAWWSNNIGVSWVQKYDIDGFRIDLEPFTAGTALWNTVRADILAKTGKEIVLMSELRTDGRGYTFDFTQTGFGTKEFYDGNTNFVDFVKNNRETFETAFISNHDKLEYVIKGRLGAMAYGAILSPLVPYWMVGEEFNGKGSIVPTTGYGKGLYFTQINWAEVEQPENKAFLEQVRKLLQIRKQYKDILAPTDRPLNQVNIAKITNYSGTDLEPYVMWNATASIVVAAKRGAAGSISLILPTATVGMLGVETFKITNLMTDDVQSRTAQEVTQGLTFPIDKDGVVVLKIEGESFVAKPADNISQVLNAIPGLAPHVRGYVDGIVERRGVYKVNGWACMQGKADSIDVHLYVVGPSGKHFYSSGVANIEHEEGVTRACGAGTRHRFSLPLAEDAVTKYGGYKVEVHGISTYGLANWAITNSKMITIPTTPIQQIDSPTQIPATLVPNKNTAHGYFDVASCKNLAGWVVDMDTPVQSASLEIKEDAVSLGVYLADQTSADVNKIIGITGAHRFSIPTPAQLKDGQLHIVSAYGIDSSTGKQTQLQLSPRTITCTQ